jgi:S-DNA-T family DNA segregation ATPase FtsK/SpoIIIE
MTTPNPFPNDDDRPEQDAVIFDFPADRTSSDVPADDAVTAPADNSAPDTSATEGADTVRVDPVISEPGYLDKARTADPRPVIPAWLRSREAARETAGWLAKYHAHVAAFHTVRVPVYAVVLTGRSPLGAWRLACRVVGWTTDAEGAPFRTLAAAHNRTEDYIRLSDRRDKRVRSRTTVALAGALVALVGAVSVASAPPALAWSLFALVVIALGVAGRPKDRPLLGPAVVNNAPPKLTADVVERALGALGIAQINQALAKGRRISFPAPIMRDGPGWRATVDLPYGVTAADIIERRDKLASGLRRPLGCVWPEPVHEEHSGRLVIWVGDTDMVNARQTPWALAKTGTADLFRPIPFGVDQRGRPVSILLMFANLLIGAMPRQGKTFALRVILLACALDPNCELHIFELKGTGDLDAIAPACRSFGSGADKETLEKAMAALRYIYAELDRRAKAIKSLPTSVVPEKKVTPEVSGRRKLGLWPLVAAIDECQEVFSDPDFGEEAATLATAIIKRGPALGIMLILATQRPDAKSLPTGVSANVGIRFCLKVMGQLENDMVLGTSAYKNGIRATTLTARDKGIGYLLGAADDPQVVRAAYIDAKQGEVIMTRAMAAREAAGTLTDLMDMAEVGGDLLDDVARVLPDVSAPDDAVWSADVLEALKAAHPDRYSGWTQTRLSNALNTGWGIKSRPVNRTVDGTKVNQRGFDVETIRETVSKRRREA